jgi:hypothetical protein
MAWCAFSVSCFVLIALPFAHSGKEHLADWQTPGATNPATAVTQARWPPESTELAH